MKHGYGTESSNPWSPFRIISENTPVRSCENPVEETGSLGTSDLADVSNTGIPRHLTSSNALFPSNKNNKSAAGS